jgi:hypothetical protein
MCIDKYHIVSYNFAISSARFRGRGYSTSLEERGKEKRGKKKLRY